MPWYTSIVVQCPGPPNFSSFPFPSGAGPPTRSHLHAECKSRNPTRSHGNSGEGVAAQYRLSAPTGRPENDVSSCLLNPELRQVARNRESSERAALFYGRRG